MTTNPVTPARIKIATENGIANAGYAATACREADLPYFVACALLEQESGGRNIYGHDPGGTLSGFPDPVNFGNWRAFRWMVVENGGISNGVGPCQLTYPGYFTEMEKQGLKPWRVHDNMLFGFRLLAGYHQQSGDWVKAGAEYNGGPGWQKIPAAINYGHDLSTKVKEWKHRFGL